MQQIQSWNTYDTLLYVRRLGVAAVASLCVTAAPPAARAQDAPASAPSIEPEVVAIVGRMADFLSGTPAFEVEANVTYDARQASGAMVQFGRWQRVAVQRPNRLAVDVERDDGAQRTVQYDGTSVAFWYPDDNAYGRLAAPDTIEGTIAFLEAEFGVEMPLADLLHPDGRAAVLPQVESGHVVGRHWVGDVLCDHVAISNQRVDAQLWIAAGDAPLLQRLVIMYKTHPGNPRFSAQFSNWNLEPKFGEDTFHFVPPDDAAEIQVLQLPQQPGPASSEASS